MFISVIIGGFVIWLVFLILGVSGMVFFHLINMSFWLLLPALSLLFISFLVGSGLGTGWAVCFLLASSIVYGGSSGWYGYFFLCVWPVLLLF